MNKLTRIPLALLLCALILVSAPLPSAAAIPMTGAPISAPHLTDSLPGLLSFINQVQNGNANQATGLYVANAFAYPIIQQPSGKPAYVSQAKETITQFAMASSYGSLGFLAHNTLAGAKFSDIQPEALIAVVYGDGHYALYQVTQIRRFQATSPSSPYSSFVDLSNSATLTATDLFMQTYAVKGNLVLQTCIAKNGIESWGRLFIVATPYFPEPTNQQ